MTTIRNIASTRIVALLATGRLDGRGARRPGRIRGPDPTRPTGCRPAWRTATSVDLRAVLHERRARLERGPR